MARVLCIDDDVSVAKLVADIVAFCHHEPLVETDSLAVSSHLKDRSLKAVIADYMMPKMNGLEVLTIFRDIRPDVRRLLLTAAPGEEEVRRAEREGLAQLVVAKPPGINEIRFALGWL